MSDDSDEEMEMDEESKHASPIKHASFIQKCKDVGRIGPLITKLDPASAVGTVKIFDQ